MPLMCPRGSSLVALLCAAASLVATVSAGADDKRACVDAHSLSQRLRRKGRLRDARQTLLKCSTTSCPAAVVKDCAIWLNEVDAEMPSVVVKARDDVAADTFVVRVF